MAKPRKLISIWNLVAWLKRPLAVLPVLVAFAAYAGLWLLMHPCGNTLVSNYHWVDGQCFGPDGLKALSPGIYEFSLPELLIGTRGGNFLALSSLFFIFFMTRPQDWRGFSSMIARSVRKSWLSSHIRTFAFPLGFVIGAATAVWVMLGSMFWLGYSPARTVASFVVLAAFGGIIGIAVIYGFFTVLPDLKRMFRIGR
jgi:hypothetical protein